jgi:PhnB protein
MQVQPYVFFEGRCQEALEFYRRALGAEIMAMMRYKESPDPGMIQPGTEDKVMHAAFRVGDTTVFASDGRASGQPSFQGFALSLTVRDEREADRLFTALVDGGQVIMPLTTTFFSPRFGMTSDRFGVSWMVYVEPQGPSKGSRSEALARELETKARDAVATLQQLSEADWRKVTQAEKWPVGVTAHHYAGVLEAIAGTIDTVASGRPFESFTPGLIEEMNARHARDYAACTRAETIELFQKGVGVAAATIRRLSDEQLGRSAKVMSTMPPMTVEQFITGALLGHMDEHIGSIRKTVGH